MRLGILDFETTHLEVTEGSPIEIAVAVFDVDRVQLVDAFSVLMRADGNVAEHVNGIHPEMLASARDQDQAWRMTAALLRTADAVTSWNIDFDRKWLPAVIANAQPWLEAMDIEWPCQGSSHALADVCARHNAPIVGAHRALADVLAIAGLLRRVHELHLMHLATTILGNPAWRTVSAPRPLRDLIDRALMPKVTIVGLQPFEENGIAGSHGFRWDREARRWSRRVIAEEAQAFVDALPFKARIEREEGAAA